MTLQWTAGKDNSGYLAAATVFADGHLLVDAGSATAAVLGRLDATDTRAFTVVQTDLAGNVGAPSRALRVLPDLTGMTLPQARVALGRRGLTVGRVTIASIPGVKPGTIARPTGLSAAEVGTAIDLVVAAKRPRTKLAFTVDAPPHVTAKAGGRVTVRITLSKPATVSAGLDDPRGRSLKTWTFSVGAGATTKTLPIPASAERPGRYELVWIARSGVESVRRTTVVQVVVERTTRPKR
jgi:hypothetical protein